MQAAKIIKAFEASMLSITPERAEELSRLIGVCGSLSEVIRLQSQDYPMERSDALMLEMALEEAADPAALARRLRVQADREDASAARNHASAAEYAGRAAHRQRQGELGLAEDFERMAMAAEKFAARREEQAFRLRLRAATLEADLANAAALANVTRMEMV